MAVSTWNELMSSQPEKARKFYEEVVGLGSEPLEGIPFPFTMWMQDEAPVDDFFLRQDESAGWSPEPKHPKLASFATPDIDQAIKKAQELGGQILVEPVDIPRYGKAAVLKDPQGMVFGIFQGRK
jgi:uncharacterized protein